MADTLPLEHVSIEPENGDGNAPAIVMIHGRGANERDLLPLAEQLPRSLHVLSVRAPDRLGPGFTWYELDLSAGGLHRSQPDPEDYDRSLELIGTFVDAAVDAYDLDSDGIGLLGFSQGAILSLGAMVERPGAYRWVTALHGYLSNRYDESDLRAATGTPVFIGAGTQDQIIPASRGQESAERLESAGVNVTFRTYPVGHGTAPQEVRDVSAWIKQRDLTPSDTV